MFISYSSEKAFYEGIVQLVKEGLTFEADGSDWRIKLTGGY